MLSTATTPFLGTPALEQGPVRLLRFGAALFAHKTDEKIFDIAVGNRKLADHDTRARKRSSRFFRRDVLCANSIVFKHDETPFGKRVLQHGKRELGRRAAN